MNSHSYQRVLRKAKKQLYMLVIFLEGVLASILSVSVVHADVAKLQSVGFSESGSFLAFEESGWQSGKGTPFARLYLVDVKNNLWVRNPYFVSSDDNGPNAEIAVRRKAEELAMPDLRRLKIQLGRTGRHVVSRPYLTNAGDNRTSTEQRMGHDPFEVRFDQQFSVRFDQQFSVILATRAIQTAQCKDQMGDQQTAAGMSVMIRNLGRASGMERYLQNDFDTDSVPANRSCPIGYRIQDVYIYRDSIAVFLNVFQSGFEAELDVKTMAVTGPLW